MTAEIHQVSAVMENLVTATTIYSTVERPNVKRRHFYHAYEDDPTFIQFKADVMAMCEKTGNAADPAHSLLYKLWYESANFRTHWESKYTNETAKKMVFIFSERLVGAGVAMVVMGAWINRTYAGVGLDWLDKWATDIFQVEWDRLEPDREKKRRKKNKDRREKRHMRTGRPKQTADTALGIRIFKELQQRPATAPILAVILKANVKAIASQLLRMQEKGEIAKLCRGQYTANSKLMEELEEVENEPVIEAAVERQPEPQSHPLSKNEHERIFRRLQQMRPDVDRVKFQELISDPEIGLESILGTITQYEEQFEHVA